MRDNVTFDRPIPAKLVVQLENGETFDATDEHVAAFGLVNPHTAYKRFTDWLARAHPESALSGSPLNVITEAVSCALMYPDMPGEEALADVRSMVAAALTLHLVSEHAVGGIVADPFDHHDHEHTGPGTIRNHDRDRANFDPAKVRQILAEAHDLTR